MTKTLRVSLARSMVVLFTVLGVTFSPQQKAFAFSYGNHFGLTADFLNVNEASGTDPGPLFGMPTLSLNTLDFNPTNFTSFSTAGGTDITDGQLNFSIKAHTGYSIPFVNFSEAGDFTLIKTASANAFADVSATFFIDIKEVNNVPVSLPLITASMTFSPNPSGTFILPGMPPGPSLLNGLWNGAFSFDVNAALAGFGYGPGSGATLIDFSLDNTLSTISEINSSAFIAKKDFKGLGITVFDPNVPEPTTFSLTLCGALLVFKRLRRSQPME